MAGKFHEDTWKKRKGAKTAARHDWPKLHMAQCDWPKSKIWRSGVNRLFFSEWNRLFVLQCNGWNTLYYNSFYLYAKDELCVSITLVCVTSAIKITRTNWACVKKSGSSFWKNPKSTKRSLITLATIVFSMLQITNGDMIL